ncbi:2-oxoglutarate dehydrogenase E1 component [Geopsychrobacter electrodiphilus]|uniref:2-oxoglutarate dehydrogenase E1 component n=1 Tax=Geopsychrobacter electrodiphilus TaxID=225196 RepID=UPI00036A4500|nr:2-oxoglutarate dehydrogenase E1 component [Geopsychrobacter electrodiphilus]
MNFASNVGPQWLDAQYQLWREDPNQVPADWRGFFEGYELGQQESASEAPPDHRPAAVQTLIRRYREIGHLLACVDPLTPCTFDHPQLRPEVFGLSNADLNTVFAPADFFMPQAKLGQIIEILQQTYCRSIGVEFMHAIPEERRWLQDRMETRRNNPHLAEEVQLAIFRKLQEATSFERFLHKKFLGQKRFSLEGGESVIALLEHLIRRGARRGLEHIVIGMSHRGRLNVLANIFGKPLENIFAEFKDNTEYQVVGEGDVKYHKGYSGDRVFSDDKKIHISLASNPSHLEAVDPVVEGKSRARQDAMGPEGIQKVLPLLLHGDSAFAGQGVVAETLNLSALEGYTTGGTLHVVINNQIGFTTLPADSRSTCYPTDIAKMLMAPIFHVHGDDPEALLQAAILALDFRQTFGRDVVIEVICFRRYGHNEGDEPFFTQPLMYEKIKLHPPAADIYYQQLRDQGIEQGVLDQIRADIEEELEAALIRPEQKLPEAFQSKWEGVLREHSFDPVETGVPAETLKELCAVITHIPNNFNPHKKIASLLQRRMEQITQGEKIDWGTGEALAFASLLAEEKTIRLSGQDSRRGTFNHRHATLVDMLTAGRLTPLEEVARQHNCQFHVYNSSLSEFAVLGFDYGYSVENPHGLTIWEAQFGDFANGAQVIIDQFIGSSGTKWERYSALTMFLPHGYEGQGPEHSSARIERYLQLCADQNIQIVYPTTPAQLFHLLRRQLHQPFRRPLIVFTPKGMLRHPSCVSQIEDFTSGHFNNIIGDDLAKAGVERLLFCSGRIYYDLLQYRQQQNITNTALIRIEQLYPLDTVQLHAALKGYRKKLECRWVQEEIANGGAWQHIRDELGEQLGRPLTYVGRKASASSAVGSHRIHNQEQQQIITQAFLA